MIISNNVDLPQPVVPAIPIIDPLGIVRLRFLKIQGDSFEYWKDKFFNSIDFMNEFGNDWNDIKVIILYQKLYQSIKKQYYNKYNKKIPNKLLIVILVKLFENNKVRKIIMNRFIEYINSEIKDDNIIDLRNNSYNNLLLLN